jgi:hypothetical protein
LQGWLYISVAAMLQMGLQEKALDLAAFRCPASTISCL